jgi:hypothetical protein
MASPFFKNLSSAYRAELDDLTFDSEGKDVLRQRLADKRKEMGFLVKMMDLSPEMVAVVFHQAFAFKSPAVMDDLLSFEADELPDWSTLAGDVTIATWAQDLADAVLAEPGGEWFLTVAASLEYMAGKPGAHATDAEDDDESDDEDDFDGDAEERADAKARKEAGDDWMAEQGFDRKE